MKHFKNQNALSSCHDFPRLKLGSSSKESCCASISGAFDDSYYDEENLNYRNYDYSSISNLGVGISSKMKNSEVLWNKSSKLIPGGGQTFSKSPMCYVEGISPKFLEGKGSRVWDVDGNHLDYVGCFPMPIQGNTLTMLKNN